MAQVTAKSILVLLIAVLVISVRSLTLSALAGNGSYKDGDYIPLFANKVHPPNDQCEAYPYFELPFCPPGSPITNRTKSLEEVLEGDCFTNTQYRLNFKVKRFEETLCEKDLTKEELKKFRHAIRNKFEIQMYYNNIRMQGVVGYVKVPWPRGNVSSPRYYLIKHIDFDACYHGDQIKEIYLMSAFSSAVDITEDAAVKVRFTYSVFWRRGIYDPDGSVLWNTALGDADLWPIDEKGEGVSKFSFLSLICAIVAWVGLLAAVSVLYLRSYLRRYSIASRQIHGDGCRCPPYSSLLGAILGIGIQLLILVCTLFVLAYRGVLYPCNRGKLAFRILPTYSLASAISGFVATLFHTRYNTTGWRECVFQTGVLYLVPAFLTFMFMNTLSEITLGTSDLPQSGTRVAFLFIWGAATVAILGLGGAMAYAYRPRSQVPPTGTTPSLVPQLPWYMKTPAQMFLGGLIHFMLMYKEMDTLFASLWNQRVCGAFGSMLTAFIWLCLITLVLGFLYALYQLSNLQDQGLWWSSVLHGGSTAIFMFAYGIYFHVRANKQLDTIKLLLFLGYNACLFYALFLILGTIGFFSSLLVFHLMYRGDQKNR